MSNPEHSKMSLPKKPKKYLLITGIVLIAIVFVFAFMEIICQSSFDTSRSLNTTMSTTTKWGNTWKMRFKTANGVGEHTFNVKGEGYGLIYSGSLAEGEMKMEFCDNDGNVIAELLPNTSDTLWNVENGEKYKVVVTANNAKKGSFSFQMKDLKKSE